MDAELKEILLGLTNTVNQLAEGQAKIIGRLDKVDSRLDKVELSLEDLRKDVKIIAEVQKSHMEQNERQHTQIMKELRGEIGLIDTAVKQLSSRG